MLGLVATFLFAGYTLIYAAVAAGGKFAATPWEALRQDAYTGPAGPATSAGGAHQSTFDRLLKIGETIANPFGTLLP